MKRLISGLCLLTTLIFAGCFDIKEEIFLEKNGSGKYITTIDMTQLKDMLEMLKTMMPDSVKESTDELKGLNSMDSIQNIWKDIDKVAGVTDVKRIKKADMIYEISFRFADIKALNTAMTKKSKSEDSVKVSGDFYSFSAGQFACNDTSFGGMGDLMKGMNGGIGNEGDSTAMALNMMKGLMGDMKYTSIYHLPGKVNSFSNKNAKLSEDGKTITLEINLSETEKEQSLKNTIRYNK